MYAYRKLYILIILLLRLFGGNKKINDGTAEAIKFGNIFSGMKKSGSELVSKMVGHYRKACHHSTTKGLHMDTNNQNFPGGSKSTARENAFDAKVYVGIFLKSFGFVFHLFADERDRPFNTELSYINDVGGKFTAEEATNFDEQFMKIIEEQLAIYLSRGCAKIADDPDGFKWNRLFHGKMLKGLMLGNTFAMKLLRSRSLEEGERNMYEWIMHEAFPKGNESLCKTLHALELTCENFLRKLLSFASLAADGTDEIDRLNNESILDFAYELREVPCRDDMYGHFTPSISRVKMIFHRRLKQIVGLEFYSWISRSQNIEYKNQHSLNDRREKFNPVLNLFLNNMGLITFMMDTDETFNLLENVYEAIEFKSDDYQNSVKSFIIELRAILKVDKIENDEMTALIDKINAEYLSDAKSPVERRTKYWQLNEVMVWITLMGRTIIDKLYDEVIDQHIVHRLILPLTELQEKYPLEMLCAPKIVYLIKNTKEDQKVLDSQYDITGLI